MILHYTNFSWLLYVVIIAVALGFIYAIFKPGRDFDDRMDDIVKGKHKYPKK